MSACYNCGARRGHEGDCPDVINALVIAARAEGYAAGFEAGKREAARVAESYEPRCDSCPRGVATAIRALARGEHESRT